LDLCIRERLVLVFIPAEAREQAQTVCNLLLRVQAKAVLDCAKPLGLRNVGRGDLACKILLHRLAIIAHVRVVHIAENANRAQTLCAVRVWLDEAGQQAFAQLELPVLAVGTAEGPIEIDAVGDDGHCRDAVARRPDTVVVFKHSANRVTARVRGVVPCAVVVDGPVGELQMAVRANGIQIENIRKTHLPHANIEPA
jgi:hypothetical protein